MSTVLKSHLPAKKPRNDPWRYGERYRLVIGPDGEEDSEVMPLKKRDLLFPKEGDRPVLTWGHTLDVRYLTSVLIRCVKNRRRTVVLSEHRIDFGVPDIEPLGPDVILVEGVARWNVDRGTLPVVQIGARPLLVMEVTSPDTRRNDLGIKRDLYFRCGVLEYGIVDRPGNRRKKMRALGYRAGPDGYEEIPPDNDGRIWFESIGVWLGVSEGRAICWDKRGQQIPSLEEQVAAAEKKATAEAKERKKLEARLKELEAELKRRRSAEHE